MSPPLSPLPVALVYSHCGETCAATDSGVGQGGGDSGMKGLAVPSFVTVRTSSGVQGPRSPSLMAHEDRDGGQMTLGEVVVVEQRSAHG